MSLFATSNLAAGYASARPALHGRILQLADAAPCARALDVGCGAGLSTAALSGIAAMPVGVEPACAMLRYATGGRYLAAAAEALPFRDGSFPLLTAAGALNYIDLAAFAREARRVLTSAGQLLVYDFSPGRRFADGPGLEDWFNQFLDRYPPARDGARALDPETLAAALDGFSAAGSRAFSLEWELDASFYQRYMITETNVAYAIAQGASEAAIRDWLGSTVPGLFGGRPRPVIFDGYYAWFRPIR